MKTALEYLRECKEMAEHNLFCYSEPGIVPKPQKGYEDKFEEAVRDCEIVDELMALVRETSAPAGNKAQTGGYTEILAALKETEQRILGAL